MTLFKHLTLPPPSSAETTDLADCTARGKVAQRGRRPKVRHPLVARLVPPCRAKLSWLREGTCLTDGKSPGGPGLYVDPRWRK